MNWQVTRLHGPIVGWRAWNLRVHHGSDRAILETCGPWPPWDHASSTAQCWYQGRARDTCPLSDDGIAPGESHLCGHFAFRTKRELRHSRYMIKPDVAIVGAVELDGKILLDTHPHDGKVIFLRAERARILKLWLPSTRTRAGLDVRTQAVDLAERLGVPLERSWRGVVALTDIVTSPGAETV